MTKIVILLCCLAITSTLAKPASNEQLDKATENDVAINAVVIPEKKVDQKVEATEKKENEASISISGISTGIDGGGSSTSTSSEDTTTTLFKPQRAGSMFARFIDDIFQIPITVLQSVAKLITNPFTLNKKTPEGVAATS